MKVFFEKTVSFFLGITTSASLLLGVGLRIPQPIKKMRRQEMQEDNKLYLEHAKTINSEIDWNQLQHTSHRSHRSHSSHRSHRSHTSSSTSSTTSSYRSSSSSSSTYKKNTAPIAENQSVTVKENTKDVFNLIVKDKDGDNLSNFVVIKPTHGKLDISGNVANYTPEKDYTGPDTFQYKSYDGKDYSNLATVKITVVPEKITLDAKSKIITVFKNSPREINLSIGGADGNLLKYFLSEPPKHGKISIKGSLIIYTPDKDYLGIDGFKFVVFDGKKISQATNVVISVIKKK
jgi:hypothetical protein